MQKANCADFRVKNVKHGRRLKTVSLSIDALHGICPGKIDRTKASDQWSYKNFVGVKNIITSKQISSCNIGLNGWTKVMWLNCNPDWNSIYSRIQTDVEHFPNTNYNKDVEHLTLDELEQTASQSIKNWISSHWNKTTASQIFWSDKLISQQWYHPSQFLCSQSWLIFDSDMSFSDQINSVSKSCHFHIRDIRRIRHLLPLSTATALANSLVSSKLDYCNSLYSGISQTNLNKLQRIQNSLARVITNTSKYQHITPTIKKLHWLPIKQRIDYKTCLLTYKTLTNQQPTYLYNILSFPSHSVSTRSSDSLVLSIPYVRSSLGKRAFSVNGPRLWNSLPPDTRNSSSLPIFRSRLKTHLFKIAFPP